MRRKQRWWLLSLRMCLVACCVFTIVVSARGAEHWGHYFQGHTPAFVPHNSEHGYNQTSWRQWPDSWSSKEVRVKESRPAAVKQSPTKAAPVQELPLPDQYDDLPPLPPLRPNAGGAQPGPAAEPGDADLQPVPGRDPRPLPPPGLTSPGATDPTASPSDLPPPEGEPDPSPELAPEQFPDPAAEQFPEPTAPPDTTTPPLPGSKLPTPPTELPHVAPPESLRDSRPLQARTARRQQASEAVFRDDRRVIDRRPPAARLVPGSRAVEILPERPAAEIDSLPSEAPELFQPGAPNRVAPQGSGVKPASFETRGGARLSIGREQPVQGGAARALHQTPTAKAAPLRAPTRLRANPLRDGGADDLAESSGNPLRP